MANLVESENIWPNIECEALKDKTEWRQRDKAKANNQDLSTYIASSMFLSEYKLFVNIFQNLQRSSSSCVVFPDSTVQYSGNRDTTVSLGYLIIKSISQEHYSKCAA